MTEFKGLFQSSTFWSALLVLVASGLSLFGVDFSTEEQGQSTDHILAGVAAIGGIGAIVGRIRAKKRIA